MNVPIRLNSPFLRCLQCLHPSPSPIANSKIIFQQQQRQRRRRLISSSARLPPSPRPDSITQQRLDVERRAYYQRRTYYAATGAVACMVAIWVLATSVELPPKAEKNEAPASSVGEFSGKGVAVVGGGEVEQVLTGTTTVSSFPKTISVPDEQGTETEYHLLGLGIRTVSFLRIQVYVAGLYIAKSDIPVLQAALIREINPSATALVGDERERLREMLLDPEKNEEVWSRVLKSRGFRTLWRIVPTRGTDFMHLRDGWIRGITSRSNNKTATAGAGNEYGDEGFRTSVAELKALFPGRKLLPKGKTLLLMRDRRGALEVRYESEGWVKMGRVEDERIGRLVWLGYLGGGRVASEGARRQVVEGIVRSLGTA